MLVAVLTSVRVSSCVDSEDGLSSSRESDRSSERENACDRDTSQELTPIRVSKILDVPTDCRSFCAGVPTKCRLSRRGVANLWTVGRNFRKTRRR